MIGPSRADCLQALADRTFDLLVIGAGVIGARIAYEAASVGLSTALIDRGDFAGATSSTSSKLIHGGLRYLATGNLGLIRESHSERVALVHHIAPHLVRPIRFVMPIYRGGPHSAPVVAAGLLAYSALSLFKDSHWRYLSPGAAAKLVPGLRTEGLRGGGMYLDAQTHDARLCLATVKGAAAAGAIVLNHAEVVALEHSGRRLALASVRAPDVATPVEVRFRQVVNATGPWIDAVRRLEDPNCQAIARLSKGVHALLPLEAGWQAALTVPIDRVRVVFAIPWEGMLLLGTTDTEYHDDPARVAVTPDDLTTVLGEASHALSPDLVRQGRVLSAFAGLRVLPWAPGDTANAPREHLVMVGPGGMVSVAGGKLTTHRRIAAQVLDQMRSALGLHANFPTDEPLPDSPSAAEGGVEGLRVKLKGRYPQLGDATVDHLVHLYGTAASDLLIGGAPLDHGLDLIHVDGPDIWAQVHHAVEDEWALSVDDVVNRRTTVGPRGLIDAELQRKIEKILASDRHSSARSR